MKIRSIAAWLAAASVITIGLVTAPREAIAETARSYAFHLPAEPLADALRAVAAMSGQSIAAPADLLAGRTASALEGQYSVDAAVSLLLANSGLHARRVGNGLVIEADPLSAPATAADAPAGPDILVTGSRIRGGAIASPVITITREDARDAGQATLGEIVRDIPQSFGGGQNPGLGFNVPTASGADTGGGSSINLRGLGSDATLTLLNGHRLAYSGSRQSVDVSAIPLGAVDHIDVVADGASALYGSDAVGGVANIVLRRDMQGLETQARLGAATEGGDFQQQYDVTGGARWNSGGFIAAYEYNDASAIDARQRDYAATRSPGLRLLPSARNNNALVSAHQSLSDTLDFSIDGLFNDRHTDFLYPQNAAGDLALSRVDQTTDETAFAVAPTLSLALGKAWRVSLSGSYAEDRVDYKSLLITPTSSVVATAGCYCNRATSVELSGDGPLFDLPAGAVKLALGVGYRSTGLDSDRGAGNFQNFDESQSSKYGYGELDVPVLGAAQGSAMRLDLTAALRYEDYQSFGSVATPKFGVIWSPHPAFDLKASWGRSFRAPTLFQRFQPDIVTLASATGFGGTGYAPGSTILYIQSGNAALRPERATTWSVTADVHPPALAEFDVQLSYFSVDYVDRIVAPISFLAQSLSDPQYAGQITKAPSLATIQSIVAGAAFFQNSGGAVFDPATVVALVDNSNVNAGRQPAHGLDGELSYRTDLEQQDALTVKANATYLVSSRQISAAQPVVPLAGIIFNPSHWRARSSLGWQHARFGVTTTVSYIGPLSDTRSAPPLRIAGQATVDIALRYRTPDSATSALRGLDFILAVQDLLDATPPLIATTLVTDTPYNSTNYSPVGRFVSFTIAKKW